MSTRTPDQERWIEIANARLESDPEFKKNFEQNKENALRELGVPEHLLGVVAQGAGN